MQPPEAHSPASAASNTPPDATAPIGYVVKRYPRFSETFIVNEILAHEAAGHELRLAALNPSSDTHFQEILARVRAPVHYLTPGSDRTSQFWQALREGARRYPDLPSVLIDEVPTRAREVRHALMLADLVRQAGLEHLHAHFATSAATVTRLAARLAGVPYTLTAHAKDIYHHDHDRQALAAKFADAAAVITVSDYNLAYLRKAFPAGRFVRIYNGLDLQRFGYLDPAERPTGPVPLILAVGRLVAKKGFDDLLAACAVLRDRKVAFRCLVVGGGECDEALAAQRDRLELHEHVTLLGPRPQAEVIALMRQATVLAAPCVVADDGNRDGLPTVLLEAMALGTSCIATDVTGIPEVLIDGETGLLIPQRNPHALAAALERMLGDGSLRRTLAQRARRRIEAKFDIHRNAAALREVFTQARRRSSTRPRGDESTVAAGSTTERVVR